MKFQRHLVFSLAGAAIAVTAMSSTATYAEAGSNHPMRIILHCAAGSPADRSVREIAKWWSEHMGRRYYVENVPNAPQTVGMGAATTSETDKVSRFYLGDVENVSDTPQTVGMGAATTNAKNEADKYSMLFDLGDCENEASSPE
jgi:tripartite-type tricarboxylate transporter receptor subunit TctC